MADLQNNSPIGAQSYKDWLLTNNLQSKLSPEYGKKLAQDIESKYFSNASNSYSFLRNERFKANILWSSGKINIYAKFADRLNLNGKINYANVNYSVLMIVNRIISGLVGRWMERQEKIQVTAIDPLSVNDKKEQYEQAEFVLQNRAQLEELQQKSGVPMISPDQFVAEDKDDLEEWAVTGTKLPEEIKYETGTNDILDNAGFFDVLKEKLLHDSAECGLVSTYVWMDEYGVIHPEWIKPMNTVYSYSEFNDFRDTAMRGFVKSMKITEIRRQFGTEFGGKISEEEIFKIAQTAKEYQRFDKLTWNYEWLLSYIRPYDEWNVEVLYFWLKSVDEDDGMVMTVTKQNKSTILERVKQRPNNLDTNQEYIDKKDKWNLYKGVYARESLVMLEWGLDNNMIRPQDPKESGDVEFPVSLYMYQNQDMRNVALPEKIEMPIEQMIITYLKMQQVIATMVPVGAAINMDAMQELDLGLAADGKSPIDAQKVYQQTGILYYRGRDAEGNPIPVPIQELQNAGFINQMKGLIELYQFHYNVVKDELGEDPNLISAAAQPRVTSENIQASQQMAAYSTDYMYNAYKYIIEETSKKIACLLNNSVRFGASAYRHIMQEEDVKDRNFSTKVKLLPDQYAIQRFESFLNQSLAANPELAMYLDSFKLIRIAKENVKLAEVYYHNSMKKMRRSLQEQAQRQQEDNAKIQVASSQAKAESDFKLERAKASLEIMKSDAQSKASNESALLSGLLELYKAAVPIPPELAQLKNLVFTNVGLSLQAENKQMIQEATMEQMSQMQQQEEAQESPEQEMQEQQMQPQ